MSEELELLPGGDDNVLEWRCRECGVPLMLEEISWCPRCGVSFKGTWRPRGCMMVLGVEE